MTFLRCCMAKTISWQPNSKQFMLSPLNESSGNIVRVVSLSSVLTDHLLGYRRNILPSLNI